MAETLADEDGDGDEDEVVLLLFSQSSLSSFSLFSSAYLSPLLHLISPPASSTPPISDLSFLFPDLGFLSRPRPPLASDLNPKIWGISLFIILSDLGDIEAWPRERASTPRTTMVGPRWLISAVLMVLPFRGVLEVLAVLRCLREFRRSGGEGASGWRYPDDTGHGSGGGGFNVRDQRYPGGSCYGYGSGGGSDGRYFGGSSGDYVVCGYHQYGRRSFSPESFSLGTYSVNEE